MTEIYIVFLPDKKTKECLEKIQRSLVKKYNLKITNHPLHITLRTSFSVKDYELLLRDLTRYAKKFSAFEVTSDKYDVFNRKTMVLTFKKEKNLLKIEKDVVKLCKKHMVFEKPFKKYKDLLSQSYYNKYRDIYVLERYNPHITMFYDIKNKDIDVDLKKIDSNFCFVCDAFAVVEKTKTSSGTLHKIKDVVFF